MEDRLFELDVNKGYLYGNMFSEWIDLAYDIDTCH